MVEAGTILENRYLIQKQIGAGGMGTVFQALDQRLKSSVAIKETLFDDAELQHAFEREAQLLNSLRHPALPHVIDYFTASNRQYLVMEYFAGEDLSEILKRQRLFPVAEVLRRADDLLDALIYLHSQKTPVIHRDIKPQNLKLTPTGEIILLDFGLAKGKPGEASQLSRVNSVFGYSRSYAPLEQIQGTGTDTRSDIYSLGATLYHLLTGKPPIDALTRATAFINNQPDPLVLSSVLNPQIPFSIAQIVHNTLNLNPDLRPQTMIQLRNSLRNAELQELADSDDTKIPAINEKVSTSSTAQSTPLANLENVARFDNPEIPITAKSKFAENSFLEPFSSFGSTATKNRGSLSLEKFLSITAAILIVGGGCFAAWYIVNQSSKAQAVNSNSPTSAPPMTKAPAIVGSSAKIEEKNSNQKIGANTVAIKLPELSNKTALNKLTDDETAFEESNSSDSLQPIIVKSAVPTKDLKQSHNEDAVAPTSRKKESKSESDDSEDVIEIARKRKKADAQFDESRIQKRERRVSDKRKKQVLPTLLGAPPN